MGIIVGIDASRNRSGGAIAHLRGLLSNSDPQMYGIKVVHLWAYRDLLVQVADKPWLIKHDVQQLNGSIWKQLWWQYFILPRIFKNLGCDIMFNSDAGSVCPVRRSATLSQDMLSFEPGEMQRFGLSKARLRLEVLKVVQVRSLRRSILAMFLSEHARQVISQVTGPLVNSVVIPHGIDERFRGVSTSRRPWPKAGPIRCLYVSNTAPYKHQWHVVKAVADLRQKGYELELNLVGGGSGRSLKRLMASLNYFDPHRDFVKFEDFVPNERIPSYLAKSDLFIFASSCENLPVTMLEAMASGIPICSSNRGPMPEVLGKNGCYFDPECPATIAEAILSMIIDDVSRVRRSEDSLERSQQYTWQICGINTWQALVRACQKDWK